MCPAFPAMGRRLVEGELVNSHGDGVRNRHLPKLIRSQTGLDVTQIGLTEIRHGSRYLVGQMQLAISKKMSICCADAENDRDLSILAETVMELPQQILPVGSAGFAQQLAPKMAHSLGRQLIQGPHIPQRQATKAHPGNRPVVYFVGSVNRVTERQLVALSNAFGPVFVDLDEVGARRFTESIRDGQHLVVRIGWSVTHRRYLDTLLNELVGSSIAGTVVTGGDTLKLLCDVAGSAGIDLNQQVEAGLAKGRLVGGRLDGTVLVTKAGGFGKDETLVRVLADLTRQQTHLWRG